jgi:FtsH-binding integral membrane protein
MPRQPESLLVAAISPGGGGLVHFASNIRLYLSLTLVASAVLVLILLIASLIPLPKVLRSKRNRTPLIVLVLMELALIRMAVAFQVRTSWFHQVKEMEGVFD